MALQQTELEVMGEVEGQVPGGPEEGICGGLSDSSQALLLMSSGPGHSGLEKGGAPNPRVHILSMY